MAPAPSIRENISFSSTTNLFTQTATPIRRLRCATTSILCDTNFGEAFPFKMDPSAQKPLRILAIVNVPWDPRFGAARVWIELTEEWSKAGHAVDKFCLTDAFPAPASSPALAAVRLILFPFHAARFVRQNTNRFAVIDALVGTLPFSKRSLSFRGLLVARSVGLFYLYEKFQRSAARRWSPASK